MLVIMSRGTSGAGAGVVLCVLVLCDDVVLVSWGDDDGGTSEFWLSAVGGLSGFSGDSDLFPEETSGSFSGNRNGEFQKILTLLKAYIEKVVRNMENEFHNQLELTGWKICNTKLSKLLPFKPQISRELGAVLYPGSTDSAPSVLYFTYSITWPGACFLVKKGQVKWLLVLVSLNQGL